LFAISTQEAGTRLWQNEAPGWCVQSSSLTLWTLWIREPGNSGVGYGTMLPRCMVWVTVSRRPIDIWSFTTSSWLQKQHFVRGTTSFVSRFDNFTSFSNIKFDNFCKCLILVGGTQLDKFLCLDFLRKLLIVWNAQKFKIY
jgi:hypothetical protein